MPVVVLAASFLGFGAQVRQSGLTLWHGLFSTATGWALPGQVALVELYAVGAPLVVIAAAVAFSNARLLPMVITLIPMLREERYPRWAYYLVAHWVAVTGWALALRDCPRMAPEARLPYYCGLGLVLWGATLVTTALGFLLAGAVPLYLSLGLVFVNPLYFLLLFAGDARARPRVLSLLLGVLAGPPLFVLSPDWGLVLTGLIAGSLGFVLGRASWRRRRA